MDNSPRLFSKLSIVIFSTLGSTVYGSFVYATNLKETNKGKFIAPVIIFSILYTYVLTKLPGAFGIPMYYAFFPIHLIGGLLLAGPFWKYHFGEIHHFQKRKIWGPTIALFVPIALMLFYIFYYNSIHPGTIRGKLSASEFQKAAQAEYNKAVENATFVSQDSSAYFFDLKIPLLKSSYFLTTKVEDVHFLYDYVDYDEGRFTTFCTRIPLSPKDKFDLTMFDKNFSFTPAKTIHSDFKSFVCANYTQKAKGVLVKGTLVLIKIDNIGYQYATQYTDLDQADADGLSQSIISNILPDSIAQAIRSVDEH